MKSRMGPFGPVAIIVVMLVIALLQACPLPQPLQVIGREDGGIVTPPRIVVERVEPPDIVVPVAKACPAGVQFVLKATIEDLDVEEMVEARWFLDEELRKQHFLPGPEDSTTPLRAIPPPEGDPFIFSTPYDGTKALHVVDLVVSNGFEELATSRAARQGYETQMYRWVFEYVDSEGRCE